MTDEYTMLMVAATEKHAMTEADRKLERTIGELLLDGNTYRRDEEPPDGRRWDDLRRMAHTGKRGRPRKYVWDEYLGAQGEYSPSTRAMQNRANATSLWLLLSDLWEKGAITTDLMDFYDQAGDGSSYRHQGIGEQIGRMLNGGVIDEIGAVQLAMRCAYLVTCAGYPTKLAERLLRAVSKDIRDSTKLVAATENKEG